MRCVTAVRWEVRAATYSHSYASKAEACRAAADRRVAGFREVRLVRVTTTTTRRVWRCAGWWLCVERRILLDVFEWRFARGYADVPGLPDVRSADTFDASVAAAEAWARAHVRNLGAHAKRKAARP